MNNKIGSYPRYVTLRICDEACAGGYDLMSVLLVNENTAITVVQGDLEICRVACTEDDNTYDHVESFYPSIYAGKDEEFAFHDLMTMTAAEFFGKYPCYGEYVKTAKQSHKEAIAMKEQQHPYVGFEL